MKATFAHTWSLRLLRLYPRAWRERYADEAAAVLEERPATFLTLFDLLLGMLDASLHKDLFTERKFVMLQRLRNSQITIFCSLIFFALLWSFYSFFGIGRPGIGNLWELPSWYYASGRPNYDFTFAVIYIVGLCPILTGLVGGTAFITVTLKQAFGDKRKRFFRFFILWLLSIFAVVMLTIWFSLFRSFYHDYFALPLIAMGSIVTSIYGHSPAPLMNVDSVFAVIWSILVIWAVCAGPICLIQGARRVEFTPRFIRFAFILAAIATFAMIVILAVMFFQAVEMDINAPDFRLLRTTALNVLVFCIALPTMLSCVSLWRGFKAQRALAPA